MKPRIKIVYSNYYPSLSKGMLQQSKKILKSLGIEYDEIGVPGSFEIPYEISRSIKEDTLENQSDISKYKKEEKKKIRDNIVQLAKLSQLNLSSKCIYSGYLALGCIIKGETINHEAISVSIFTNLQRLSIENIIPIGNGIFNANNLKEAKKKASDGAIQACKVLYSLVDEKKK